MKKLLDDPEWVWKMKLREWEKNPDGDAWLLNGLSRSPGQGRSHSDIAAEQVPAAGMTAADAAERDGTRGKAEAAASPGIGTGGRVGDTNGYQPIDIPGGRSTDAQSNGSVGIPGGRTDETSGYRQAGSSGGRSTDARSNGSVGIPGGRTDETSGYRPAGSSEGRSTDTRSNGPAGIPGGSADDAYGYRQADTSESRFPDTRGSESAGIRGGSEDDANGSGPAGPPAAWTAGPRRYGPPAGSPRPAVAPPPAGGLSPWARRLIVRTMLAAAVYAGIAGLTKLDQPWSIPVRSVVLYALTDEWRTDSLAAWYGRWFEGTPAWLPAYLPMTGEAVRVDARPFRGFRAPLDEYRVAVPYRAQTGAVTLQATVREAVVRAMDTGFVLQTAADGQGGFRLTIQHAGGIVSTYSGLSELAVGKSDWLRAGDEIGRLAASAEPRLVWSVTRDGNPVDPGIVVPIG